MQTQILILPQPSKIVPIFEDVHVAEDDLDRSAQNIVAAYTDLMILIRQAQTPDRCVRIQRTIAPLVELLQTAESYALDRGDAL
jgi:hypothetical protein